MLCLQQRRDAICRTTSVNLNLQVDLEVIFTSLYTPFTSPPNSPTHGTHGPPPRRCLAKNGTGPRLPMRAKVRLGNLGPSPLIFINMQVSEVLAMCQRMRRQIDLGQLRAVDMRVDLRGRNIGMAQNLL